MRNWLYSIAATFILILAFGAMMGAIMWVIDHGLLVWVVVGGVFTLFVIGFRLSMFTD